MQFIQVVEYNIDCFFFKSGGPVSHGKTVKRLTVMEAGRAWAAEFPGGKFFLSICKKDKIIFSYKVLLDVCKGKKF